MEKKKKERTRKTEKKAEISRKRNQDRHMTVTWQGKEEPNNPGSDFDSLSPSDPAELSLLSPKWHNLKSFAAVLGKNY